MRWVKARRYLSADARMRTMDVVKSTSAPLPVLAPFESVFPYSFSFDVQMAAIRDKGL